MFKSVYKFASKNLFVFVGILVGLYVSALISSEVEYECMTTKSVRHLLNKNETGPDIVSDLSRKLPAPAKKVNTTADKKSKLVRPRYYSTELGIRQKLFVGVFTSEEKVNTQAIHLNDTIGHVIDKIKFFITAQYKLKTKFNLTGLVGFTDTRYRYRPFQVIKYIGDTYGLNYDYYFLVNDYTFIDAHRLNDIVKKITVSMDVYMGNKLEDSSFCNLDAGILLSNSVLKAMREHLDWCVMNAITDNHSENIGRCVFHSIGLSCDEMLQDQSIPTFKLKHFEVSQHLVNLSKRNEFNKAVTVYPILQADDFYILNSYFLKKRLESIKEKINLLTEELTDPWPPAQKLAARPATRYDIPRQVYFNTSHMFFPDDFTNIRKHTEQELRDVLNIIEEIKSKISFEYHNTYEYRRLINGYRKFDLSRGMEYIIDIGFRDTKTGKETPKRFEVLKPLGKVEIIPVPYVTENSRVTVLLPVEESDVTEALNFMNSYASLMGRKEKTFLMLVLLYQYNTTSKGKDDIYASLKDTATKLSSKYHSEDNKIAWVSIRLPNVTEKLTFVKNRALNFAVVDLSLKKIGVDSLILMLDVYCNITADFLNRVRMNTIQSFQVFNPIPFRFYDQKVTRFDYIEVNKNVGHFDRESYKFISFYGSDYVVARKMMRNLVPIIKVDEDVSKLLFEEYENNGNLVQMFIKYTDKLHCMRATDFGLKIKYHDETDPRQHNLFLGNEAQLAKLISAKDEEINL